MLFPKYLPGCDGHFAHPTSAMAILTAVSDDAFLDRPDPTTPTLLLFPQDYRVVAPLYGKQEENKSLTLFILGTTLHQLKWCVGGVGTFGPGMTPRGHGPRGLLKPLKFPHTAWDQHKMIRKPQQCTRYLGLVKKRNLQPQISGSEHNSLSISKNTARITQKLQWLNAQT